MTEEKFLEKYGSEKVYFEEIYKFKATYSSEELGIYCCGNFDYRSALSKEETVASLFGELENFSFGFNADHSILSKEETVASLFGDLENFSFGFIADKNI